MKKLPIRAILSTLLVVAVAIVVYHYTTSRSRIYDDAKQALSESPANYAAAIAGFESLGEYRDSISQLQAARYGLALRCIEEGDTHTARELLALIPTTYENTNGYIKRFEDYDEAVSKLSEENWLEAIEAFSALGSFIDSSKKLDDAKRGQANKLRGGGYYTEAIMLFTEIGDTAEANDTKYMLAELYESNDDYEQAYNLYVELGDENKAAELTPKLNLLLYNRADELFREARYTEAKDIYARLGDYMQSIKYFTMSVRIPKLATTLSAGNQYTASVTSDGRVETTIDSEFISKIENTAQRSHFQNILDKTNSDQWTDIVSVSAGAENLIALKSDGTALAAGYYLNERNIEIIESWTDLVAVSAGYWYAAGLKYDGTVVAVGHNGDRQTDVRDWTNIVAIATGWRHTVGLKNDGTVVATGYGFDEGSSQSRDIAAWQDIVAISAGGGAKEVTQEGVESGHTVGVDKNGTVWAVPTNNNAKPQTNVAAINEHGLRITAIAAGLRHTVALTNTGEVFAVGNNDHIESNSTNSIALPCDVEKWKDMVDSYGRVVAISAGGDFTVALFHNGHVEAVGANDLGQREAAKNLSPKIYSEWVTLD